MNALFKRINISSLHILYRFQCLTFINEYFFLIWWLLMRFSASHYPKEAPSFYHFHHHGHSSMLNSRDRERSRVQWISCHFYEMNIKWSCWYSNERNEKNFPSSMPARNFIATFSPPIGLSKVTTKRGCVRV